MSDLKRKIEELINQQSRENASNTPDFILAQYLENCLDNFEATVRQRDDWYSVHLEPMNKYFKDNERIGKEGIKEAK